MKLLKKVLMALVVLELMFASTTYAQNITWQKSYGGTYEDVAMSTQQTMDGGYIVAGYAGSTDSDVTGSHGPDDYWILKLDSSGNIEWKKCFGGTDLDQAYSIQQTSDGGYIVVGRSYSNNDDVTGNHGASDFWVLRLDSLGNKVWEKSLGGSGDDWAYSVQQTTDGGYVIAGWTASQDGDVTQYHGISGGHNMWIVKLAPDNGGTTPPAVQWNKCLGGNNYMGGGGYSEAYSIQQTSDGGYIVVGATDAVDHDAGGPGDPYSINGWVAKLNSTGYLQWQKKYGGTDWDEVHAIRETSDGGYIFVGSAHSTDGDAVGNHGGWDAWVVKLGPDTGTTTPPATQWTKCVGGTLDDGSYALDITTDGGYVVVGQAYSNNGDLAGLHHGSTSIADMPVFKLNASGNLLWIKSLGGSNEEDGHSIQQTIDGGYIVAGSSRSNDGDTLSSTGNGNHGAADYWIVKLSDTSGINAAKKENKVSIVQNSSDGSINVTLNDGINSASVTIANSFGSVLYLGELNSSSTRILLNYPDGLYLVTVSGKDFKKTVKIVINR